MVAPTSLLAYTQRCPLLSHRCSASLHARPCLPCALRLLCLVLPYIDPGSVRQLDIDRQAHIWYPPPHPQWQISSKHATASVDGLRALSATFSLWQLWLKSIKSNLITDYATCNATQPCMVIGWQACKSLAIGVKLQHCHQGSHQCMKLAWSCVMSRRD